MADYSLWRGGELKAKLTLDHIQQGKLSWEILWLGSGRTGHGRGVKPAGGGRYDLYVGDNLEPIGYLVWVAAPTKFCIYQVRNENGKRKRIKSVNEYEVKSGDLLPLPEDASEPTSPSQLKGIKNLPPANLPHIDHL